MHTLDRRASLRSARDNVEMSPLRFAPVDMTEFLTLLLLEGGVPRRGEVVGFQWISKYFYPCSA